MRRIILIGMLVLGCRAVVHSAFIGEPAPQFVLKDMTGNGIALNDFRGESAVFINFWASWCPPCKQEFPELNELANEYKGHGLQVLAINLDKSPERVDKFLRKIGVEMGAITILLDPGSETVSKYAARSMPSSFIVDRDGIIRFVHFGYSEKDPQLWREEINRLLVDQTR